MELSHTGTTIAARRATWLRARARARWCVLLYSVSHHGARRQSQTRRRQRHKRCVRPRAMDMHVGLWLPSVTVSQQRAYPPVNSAIDHSFCELRMCVSVRAPCRRTRTHIHAGAHARVLPAFEWATEMFAVTCPHTCPLTCLYTCPLTCLYACLYTSLNGLSMAHRCCRPSMNKRCSG